MSTFQIELVLQRLGQGNKLSPEIRIILYTIFVICLFFIKDPAAYLFIFLTVLLAVIILRVSFKASQERMGPDKLAAALYIYQQCIISAWEDMVSDRSVDYYG